MAQRREWYTEEVLETDKQTRKQKMRDAWKAHSDKLPDIISHEHYVDWDNETVHLIIVTNMDTNITKSNFVNWVEPRLNHLGAIGFQFTVDQAAGTVTIDISIH